MIAGRIADTAQAFALRLAAQAARLAEARAVERALARRGKAERRWRDARLLWPLFERTPR